MIRVVGGATLFALLYPFLLGIFGYGPLISQFDAADRLNLFYCFSVFGTVAYMVGLGTSKELFPRLPRQLVIPTVGACCLALFVLAGCLYVDYYRLVTAPVPFEAIWFFMSSFFDTAWVAFSVSEWLLDT
jgi:hypothetical protein